MAGGDHKAGEVPAGDPERRQGGAVAGDVVPPARGQRPVRALIQAGVAVPLQLLRQIGRRVVAAGAAG